jgi:hypothetical protein
MENYHLLSFGEILNISIHNYLKRLLKYTSFFQLHIRLWMDFLNICQPKLCITPDGIQKHVGAIPHLPNIKGICKVKRLLITVLTKLIFG